MCGRIIFLLSFMPYILFSQVVNVEGKRQSDANGWSGFTEFAFDYNQSTQTDWEFSNTSYLQWDSDQLSLLLLNEINFDRAGGIDFANDGYQHIRFSRHLSNSYTIESFLQNQFDPIRDIQNRKLAGIGVRVRVKKINIGISSFYEEEILTGDLEESAVRISAYLQFTIGVKNNISLNSSMYLQPDISKVSDCKLSNETSLSIKVSDRFSLNNTIVIGYDTYPAVGIPELIYNLQNGLVFNF